MQVISSPKPLFMINIVHQNILQVEPRTKRTYGAKTPLVT